MSSQSIQIIYGAHINAKNLAPQIIDGMKEKFREEEEDLRYESEKVPKCYRNTFLACNPEYHPNACRNTLLGCNSTIPGGFSDERYRMCGKCWGEFEETLTGQLLILMSDRSFDYVLWEWIEENNGIVGDLPGVFAYPDCYDIHNLFLVGVPVGNIIVPQCNKISPMSTPLASDESVKDEYEALAKMYGIKDKPCKFQILDEWC